MNPEASVDCQGMVVGIQKLANFLNVLYSNDTNICKYCKTEAIENFIEFASFYDIFSTQPCRAWLHNGAVSKLF